MGGMLVDDDDAVARLRHDIGLVKLRPGGAERAVRGRRHRSGGTVARRHRPRARRSRRPACAGSAKPADASSGMRGQSQPATTRRSQSRLAGRVTLRASRPSATSALPGATPGCPRSRALRMAETINPRTRPPIAKAHLGLGRMDVDVNVMRGEPPGTGPARGSGRAADGRRRRLARRRAAACRAPACH